MPYRHPQSRLLIFTKAPQAGQVKRRLIPALGAEGAARLQRRLIRRLMRMMAQSAISPLELWVAPDLHHPLFRELQQQYPLSLHLQRGQDLGERMADACAEALQRSDQIVLIGSDCPALTPDLIHQTLEQLQQADAVLGPAEDGGYVLLGLKRAHPSLFQDLPWGTERVTELTRQRLRALGWRWHELPTLWDLDRPEDLLRLADLGERTLISRPLQSN